MFSIEQYTAIMVTVNVILAGVATWQRHITVSEAIRKRQKRNGR